MAQQWEESEQILSWREMQPGVYRYHGIEHRWTNDYGRPISVVTLEKEGVKMYYAPSSLYWDLKKRSETNMKARGGTPRKATIIRSLNFPNELSAIFPVFKLSDCDFCVKNFFGLLKLKTE